MESLIHCCDKQRSALCFLGSGSNKAVAQSAQGNLAIQLCLLSVSLDDLPESLPGEPLPESIEEQCRFPSLVQ